MTIFSKKTICLFGTYFPNYVRNTTLRSGLAELGFSVIEANVTLPAEKIEEPSDLSLTKLVVRIWRNIGANFALLAHYKKVRQSDLILVLYPGHLIMPSAWLLGAIFSRPVVLDESISLFDVFIGERKLAEVRSAKSRLIKTIEKILTGLADRLVVDTEANKKYISQLFGLPAEKILVVPFGSAASLYRPARGQQLGPENIVNIFFFGLYNPLQGTEIIVRAAKMLADRPNLKITMLGRGMLMQSAVEYAETNHLQNVEFLDFVPEAELVKKIQACDIMLGIFSNLPTGMRAIPNKVFAGLACAKPVITARTPAAEEVFVHGQDIFLCEPQNPQSLADAVSTLADNPELRRLIAEKGYQTFLERFTPLKVAQKLVLGIQN